MPELNATNNCVVYLVVDGPVDPFAEPRPTLLEITANYHWNKNSLALGNIRVAFIMPLYHSRTQINPHEGVIVQHSHSADYLLGHKTNK
eukprot:3936802-Amphidinium_carterae.1